MMETRIYYHDTDAGGVVYYGRYLNFMEEARVEFLEDLGFSDLKLREQGMLFAVRECHAVYLAPARYGDTIVCDAKVQKITPVKVFFHQKIRNKKNDKILVQAGVTLVLLNQQFRPTQIPIILREKLENELP